MHTGVALCEGEAHTGGRGSCRAAKTHSARQEPRRLALPYALATRMRLDLPYARRVIDFFT